MSGKIQGETIGIDLGTTYSCVGVWQNDKVEIIANDQGNRTTPSYVSFTDTERLIGDAAKNQVSMNVNNTVFDAKRLIGRKYNDPSVQADKKLWPFQVVSTTVDKPIIEVEKKQKSKNDWDIAKEMSSVTALDLGTEIRYASSILSSELRLMDIEAEKGLLLIQGISVQGKLSEFFIIPDQNTETVF